MAGTPGGTLESDVHERPGNTLKDRETRVLVKSKNIDVDKKDQRWRHTTWMLQRVSER